MTPTRANLELKARLGDPAAARAALVALGARLAAVEDQLDTYFAVPHGRLKLREINGREALLIWYDRPDARVSRRCDYHLVPTADPAGLRAALSAALTVRGEVRKRREIFLWHNVRIHLDEVAGLGRFVEFEAVLGPDDDPAASQVRLATLGERLGLTPDHHEATSYADLLGL